MEHFVAYVGKIGGVPGRFGRYNGWRSMRGQHKVPRILSLCGRLEEFRRNKPIFKENRVLDWCFLVQILMISKVRNYLLSVAFVQPQSSPLLSSEVYVSLTSTIHQLNNGSIESKTGSVEPSGIRPLVSPWIATEPASVVYVVLYITSTITILQRAGISPFGYSVKQTQSPNGSWSIVCVRRDTVITKFCVFCQARSLRRRVEALDSQLEYLNDGM